MVNNIHNENLIIYNTYNPKQNFCAASCTKILYIGVTEECRVELKKPASKKLRCIRSEFLLAEKKHFSYKNK